MAETFTKEKIEALTGQLDLILNESVAPENPDRINGVVAGVTTEKGTIYLNAAGYANTETESPITNDSIFGYFSTTKSMTTTAALKLYEEGRLDLDCPVKEYLPEFSKIGILDKVNDDGTFETHPPKNEVTMRMLLTHTAGFSYSFYSEEYAKIKSITTQPDILKANERTLQCPLLFEPGSEWHYGINVDWAGMVIEKIEGKKLGQYLKEIIFDPAGMDSCTFHLTDKSQKEKLVSMYQRTVPNQPVSLSPYPVSLDPPIDMGGSGVFGNVDDYLKFIRIWLNNGKCDSGHQILKRETISYATQNHLPVDMVVTKLYSWEPHLSGSSEFFENQRKTWSLGFMINEEDVFTGRPSGSLSWSGLANLYFWIDQKNKLGGYWASQVFPAGDISILSYFKLESTVYNILNG